MKKIKYLFIILTILFSACNSEPDYSAYLKEMGIVLSDSYEVLEHNTESAIGDFAVDFALKISDKDYESIVAKIKQTENYSEFKDGEYPNSFNKFGNDYQISGFKLGNRYFYRKEKTAEVEYYEIVLKVDKTLHFIYSED